ncbi:MAG: flagellar type III secretion system protein FliR [Alphaproteobacteria bacterium]|nr:flagellar type III secretion system protein FliR [Alphaproteobacteria bacterium]OJU58534.1 MAG: flagellar biosynthetic protein FliR [Alphaproteobacteria bacterium 62-8]MBN9556906.1 flagellar type III secretion system protein FliR [Alphaproteobacteria bacterium]MBN9567792.1 flagellar type III secretion system protein FliR [Alphaproteobacteria bacterium]MBN9571272.1 flagellar type III secretion system protein FliR [Alphaproteobacteria bacterium]
MTISFPDPSGLLLVYLLVFVRAGAMIMLLPAIGDVGVPPRVRLSLALAISLALTPVVAKFYPAALPQAALPLGLLIIQEATVGVAVGAAARLIMSALQVAGYLVATQTGLAYAQTLDPTMGVQGAIVGTFFALLGTVLIFATNLHHLAIGAIEGSYRMMPPGAALPTGDLAELAIRMTSSAFSLGLELAAPFLVFGFVVTASIGLLARLMPQLQVFFVAMPINIMTGFLIMMLLLGTLMTVFLNFFATQMRVFL